MDTLKFERDSSVQADTLMTTSTADSGVMITPSSATGSGSSAPPSLASPALGVGALAQVGASLAGAGVMERFVAEYAGEAAAKASEIMARSESLEDEDRLREEVEAYLAEFHEKADELEEAIDDGDDKEDKEEEEKGEKEKRKTKTKKATVQEMVSQEGRFLPCLS